MRFSGKLSPVEPKTQISNDGVVPGSIPAGAATALEPPAETPEPVVAMPIPEQGGREGPEPTRFGDWELRGRCIDF
jgi:hypothetical protein